MADDVARRVTIKVADKIKSPTTTKSLWTWEDGEWFDATFYFRGMKGKNVNCVVEAEDSGTVLLTNIFMDATLQVKRPIWMEKGWGEGNEELLTQAVIDMMQRAHKEMPDGSILIYNGIRSQDPTGETTGKEYLSYASGVMIEHFTAFHSQNKESIAADLNAIISAAGRGKIVIVKGWPDPTFNWTNSEKMRLSSNVLAEEAKEKITFSLACFLIAAQENCYFAYSWGWRELDGSLVDYPQFHKPLGKPKSQANKEGWQYSRSFEHASVWVDLAQRRAKIDWK